MAISWPSLFGYKQLLTKEDCESKMFKKTNMCANSLHSVFANHKDFKGLIVNNE